MLRAHRDALEVATTQLLEHESLTGQELEDLVAAHPPAPGSGSAPQREPCARRGARRMRVSWSSGPGCECPVAVPRRRGEPCARSGTRALADAQRAQCPSQAADGSVVKGFALAHQHMSSWQRDGT